MRYFPRRPRAFWISVCNLVGLAFSMFGVVLLFWFALPNEVPNSHAVTTSDPRMNVPEYLAIVRRYNVYRNIGLVLVLLGTVLEAVPPFCTARGSWRRRPIAPPAQPADDGFAFFIEGT